MASVPISRLIISPDCVISFSLTLIRVHLSIFLSLAQFTLSSLSLLASTAHRLLHGCLIRCLSLTLCRLLRISFHLHQEKTSLSAISISDWGVRSFLVSDHNLSPDKTFARLRSSIFRKLNPICVRLVKNSHV